MEQIYYTQCPIGYGLGASNGFQIKRLSKGYPVSGDFRHLGLRAFLAGTRVMAPTALRYRRGEDGTAEVAWLTPRSNEYETERGFWGRPGGHFAHGLRLDDAEMKALRDWPGGLHDQPFWARSDPLPSRDPEPPQWEIGANNLRWPPTFPSVAPLAEGEDPERLAALLTTLARAAREGRTLFLIGDPARLGERVALLTFAFPPPWRVDLTFSTYHDRPEELPGFRLQGTIAAARPNRAAMLAQGAVADLAAGTIEPPVEPAEWARTLAGWLVGRTEADRAAWEGTERRGSIACRPEPPGTIWDDAWLNPFFRLPALLGTGPTPPRSREEWQELSEMAAWSGRAGLAGDWAEARPASWWLGAFANGGGPRAALFRHVGLPEAWSAGTGGPWGETIGRWVAACGPKDRQAIIEAALKAAPAEARGEFAQALVQALPEAVARPTVAWLQTLGTCDRAVLLPIEARFAVGTAAVRGDSAALRTVLEAAFDSPAALRSVLDAVASEVAERPDASVPVEALYAELMRTGEPHASADLQNWALRQGDAAEFWIGSFLRSFFVEPIDPDAWRALTRQTPAKLQPALARVLLRLAVEPKAPSEMVRWVVEEVLLALDESVRPHDPAWPGAYLDRTRSGLELLKRLFTKAYPKRVRLWIDQARKNGELLPEQIKRIDDCQSYARALQSGNARALLEIELPAVPPEERGTMLAQILAHFGATSADSLDLALDTCREAWPGAFAPRAVGLEGLAGPLAEAILGDRDDPERWFGRLSALLERLGLTAEPNAGFEPDGLAAEIVAITARRPGTGFDPWRLRQFLLQNQAAWRALKGDVGQELQQRSRPESLACLKQWDDKLMKGLHTDRFFELWLNACDGGQLAAAVEARIADLKNFNLSWWDRRDFPDAIDDLRDGFACRVPIAPFAPDCQAAIDAWLGPVRRTERKPEPAAAEPNSDDLVPLDDPKPAARPRTTAGRDWSRLSAFGKVRWECLAALAEFAGAGFSPQRWRVLLDRAPALDRLEPDDRYRFLAWLIFLIEESDYVPVERLAKWLFTMGTTDADRIKKHWKGELEGLTEVPNDFQAERITMLSALGDEIKALEREAKDPARKPKGSDSRG